MKPSLLPPEVEFLIEAARCAPSPDNSQPWCFEWDGHTLIARVHHRGGFPVDYHATTVALGAATENLAMALAALDTNMSLWFLGMPGKDGVFASGPVSTHSKATSSHSPPLWTQRHTNRLPYRLEIDPGVAEQIESCTLGNVSVRVAEKSKIRQIADWVKQASEIRFQTREVNEWFAASVRYGDSPEEHLSGLHIETLALPPGGVSLLRLISDWNRLRWLNRFRAYKLFAAIEANNFQKAPLIVAIVGPSDRAGAFEAGRCLERVWLRLTELRLSAHPYYVVADLLNRLGSSRVPEQCVAQSVALQDSVRQEYGRDNTLHCLLRVGTAVGEVPVSGRLPLSRLMSKP